MKAGILLATLVLAASAMVPVSGAAAGTASVPAAAPTSGWSWPLAPRPAVLRTFDPPDKPWMSGHRGVDLQAAVDGAPVTAPQSGTVSFVGVVVDRPVITIDHGNGLRSSFEPVESGLASGATVSKGDVLGTVLPGHCAAMPCVHWGVRRGEEYINPLPLVADLRPSILLPLRVPG
ncbi:murein hydrolase activator EnvC family protein [Arthrobacter oryzae]|jgi:murein DD-endopeptidase MepM/ murein hydrolase activator NlpD|uniref:murein hydrolase activator EnvC family protein n=1 Tax=Arthrobacter oryzae TaxID=409290 RepID=UPI002788D943|nr:M23 family metallopeptidase [Arthrobacter oryzae]MDQ0077264.1 murein DD-endopeptidase MepM/ murein hydrolase activator NlpD [Arthrobacter oryzae]